MGERRRGTTVPSIPLSHMKSLPWSHDGVAFAGRSPGKSVGGGGHADDAVLVGQVMPETVGSP